MFEKKKKKIKKKNKKKKKNRKRKKGAERDPWGLGGGRGLRK